jgi:S1-C subfamily serine protease
MKYAKRCLLVLTALVVVVFPAFADSLRDGSVPAGAFVRTTLPIVGTSVEALLSQVGGSVCRITALEGPYEVAWEKRYWHIQESAKRMVTEAVSHVRMTHSSCVIVDAERGILVTNHHVIDSGAEPFTAFEAELPNVSGRIPLKLLGSDEGTDIAVLRVAEGGRSLPVPSLVWANSDALRPGQVVVAVGYPGKSYAIEHDTYHWNATVGIVSGRNRNEGVTEFVPHTAITDKGYSGGCLFTLSGECAGIHAESEGRGLSYAVSSNLVQFVVDEIVRHGKVRRAEIGTEWDELRWISPKDAYQFGVSIEDWERFRDHALIVTDVVAGGPADAAGVLPGDFILSIDNLLAVWSLGVSRYISMQRRVGDIVTLKIYRPSRKSKREISVVLGERHWAPPQWTTLR